TDGSDGLLDLLKPRHSAGEEEREDVDGPLAEHRPRNLHVESRVLLGRGGRGGPAPFHDLPREPRAFVREFRETAGDAWVDIRSQSRQGTQSRRRGGPPEARLSHEFGCQWIGRQVGPPPKVRKEVPWFGGFVLAAG